MVGIALALGPIIIVIEAVATSLYELVSSLQAQELSLPHPPLWLDGTTLVGQEADGDLGPRRYEPARCSIAIRPIPEGTRRVGRIAPDLGDVDMEGANGLALELVPIRLVAVDLRQPSDPMTLEAPMQG